jgi:hypothetical protein
MKKIIPILIILLFVFNFKGYSQLSDRVNSPSTFKVGTRPLKGNFGISFGISTADVKDFVNIITDSIQYKGTPLVSFKYYVTDKVVARLGFKVSNTSKTVKGLVDPLVDGSFITERNEIDNFSSFLLSPGIEYHFSSTNLLDVYVGGLFPVGMTTKEFVDDTKYSTGEYNLYTRSLKSFTYGYEVFAGLQAFIADLPVAIGFDFGFSGLGHLKDKYKHESKILAGGITIDQTYYTKDPSPVAGVRFTKYRDLTSQNFVLDPNIRLTLTYFFNK